MKTKYQVFVSSTFEDLKAEREQVIKAILEMGHIPVGMEMFSAGDEQQWELIKKQIDDCDYHVVIVAHRYGSIDAGLSYTEKEYDYAVAQSIPALGFVISDDARWPKSSVESESTKQEALLKFKEKVKRKIVSFWTSHEDLYAKVSVALSKAITTYSRPGWIRATSGVGPEVTAELSRLSKENATLRGTLASSTNQHRIDEEEDRRKTLALLQANKVRVALFYKDHSDWTDGPEVSLYHVFRLLAPELLVEKCVKDSATYLGVMLNNDQTAKKVRKDWPIPSNMIHEWLADFHALGVIEPSSRKHHLKDDNQYWSITEKGKMIYSQIRISILEKNAISQKTKA